MGALKVRWSCVRVPLGSFARQRKREDIIVRQKNAYSSWYWAKVYCNRVTGEYEVTGLGLQQPGTDTNDDANRAIVVTGSRLL